MKLFAVLLIITVAVCSCNNEPASQTNVGDTASVTPVNTTSNVGADSTLMGCYARMSNRDTIMLQLDSRSGSFSGPLTINLFEKDRNEGTFSGDLSSGLLSGWYMFRSEGLMSVRQVIYRVELGRLVPGVGPMTEKNDSMYFQRPEQLNFDTTQALRKVQCTL